MIVLLVSDNGTRLVFLGSFYTTTYSVSAVQLYHLPSRPLCYGHESSQITQVALFITSVGWVYCKLNWACSVIEFWNVFQMVEFPQT